MKLNYRHAMAIGCAAAFLVAVVSSCPIGIVSYLTHLPALFLGVPGLAMISGGFVMWGNLRLQRDRYRRANGLCLRCGYDLRASTERCPECGKPLRR